MPTNIVDYDYSLTEEDMLSILFHEERGLIIHFVVQYSALIGGTWRGIMRYDTSHGYAHRHAFHSSGDEYIVNLTEPGEPLEDLFTQSSADIKQNFLKIKENFLRT